MKSIVPCTALFVFATTVTAADLSDGTAMRLKAISKIDSPSVQVSENHDGKADRIVVYSASWCAPCQRLKPILSSLKHEGYQVEYFDIEKDNDKLKYEHRSVPTIFFLRGESVIKKETGYRTRDHIVRMLRSDSQPIGETTVPEAQLSGSSSHRHDGITRY